MTRTRTTLSALFLCGCACAALAQAPADTPATSIAPREFLKLFDINEQSLATFEDGEPLGAAERERMLAILFRLRKYPLTAIDHFTRSADALSAIDEHPSESRGELFTLAGRATRCQREQLDGELRERFGFDSYYRCTIETDKRRQLIVCALAVPAAWKLDEPIDERAGVKAMFLKHLPQQPDAEGAPPLLFVAQRVAWYPPNVLGKLGMDFGLFDEVRDRTGLGERECFYQLLASARRANGPQLEREAREDLLRRKEEWQLRAADPTLDRDARATARRALARAEDEATDIVGLFNDPAGMRGSLVTLRGEALRAIEVRVDDPDITSRFGIRRYFEVEITSDDSQNNPIVCCVAQLPEGFPLGDNIHAGVRVTGFFLKSWAYGVERDDPELARRQLAPLVIAGTLKWIPAPAPSGQSVTVAGALTAALAIAAIVLWYFRRGDRRALKAARDARLQLPERIALEDEELR